MERDGAHWLLTGEEAAGATRALAIDVDRGEAWALPALGHSAFENVVPARSRDPAVLLATDDAFGGLLHVYVGSPSPASHDRLAQAGWRSGKLFGVRVQGQTFVRGERWPAAGVRFELVPVGDAGNVTGWSPHELRLQAVALGLSHFQRPEGALVFVFDNVVISMSFLFLIFFLSFQLSFYF